MNRKKEFKRFNGYIFDGVRLTDIYSRGVLLHRDREVSMINPKTRGKFKLSENIMRDALERMEDYLHTLPSISSVEELKNRIEAGLRVPSEISKHRLDANGMSALLDCIYDKKIVDCRPDQHVPTIEA